MVKRSKQSEGILKVLSKKNYHPTADEIYRIMKKDYPSLGIATVYRNLDKLARDGEIVKLEIPGESAHYDGNVEQHYHIVCTSCGKIEDVWIDLDLEKKYDLKQAAPGFSITGYRMELRGLCNECSGVK